MSFEGANSTVNPNTRKVSGVYDELIPLSHRSIVEAKNNLGSSEVSEANHSYAMSLELLAS